MIDLYRLQLYPSKYSEQIAAYKSAERVQRADPGLVRHLISALVSQVEGRPLSAILPVAAGVPKLIGITPGNAAFDSFLDELRVALQQLGYTVQPGNPHPSGPSQSAALRTELAARAMGVSAAGAARLAARSQTSTPRSVRRFDQLSAMFAESPTVADALRAGTEDGLPAGFSDLMSAMITTMQQAFRVNDLDGVRQAGSDMAAVAVALWEISTGGWAATQRSTGEPQMVRIESEQAAHYVDKRELDRGYAPIGLTRTQKQAARITHVKVGDEFLPIAEVEFGRGQPPRRKNIKKGGSK